MAPDVLKDYVLSRRWFSSVLLFGCLCANKAGRAGTEVSCTMFEQGGGAGVHGFRPIAFTEDYENALAGVLRQIADVYSVKAGFGYYDDSTERPNAAAVSKPLTQRTISGDIAKDGTTMIGRELLKITRAGAYSGPAITAICAHEYGHIVQYKYLWKEMLALGIDVTIPKELLADFICGYYGYYRKKSQPEYPAVIQAQTQFSLGDGEYKAETHGTYYQRGCCVYAGFQLGERGIRDIKEVGLRGLDYVIGMYQKGNTCPQI
jgi:hypothetical protein